MPLDPDEQQHLTAAEGYVELGMYLDADAELDRIDPYARHVPEVLVVRVEIYRALGKWELMQTVARKLTHYDSKDVQAVVWLAYATRRAESIQAAKAILLDAVEHLPAAIIHYNLACYECQLGEVEVAKVRLQHAFKLEKELRSVALDDEDLKPIWDSLSS